MPDDRRDDHPAVANHYTNTGADLAEHAFFHTAATPPTTAHKRGKGRMVVPNVFGKGTEETRDFEHEVEGDRVVREVRTSQQAATDFDGGTIAVGRAADSLEVAQILPRDTLRRRCVITNNGASAVLIGKMSGGLGQGNGYTLVANGGTLETFTTARVHACVVASAAANAMSSLSVWVERD